MSKYNQKANMSPEEFSSALWEYAENIFLTDPAQFVKLFKNTPFFTMLAQLGLKTLTEEVSKDKKYTVTLS